MSTTNVNANKSHKWLAFSSKDGGVQLALNESLNRSLGTSSYLAGEINTKFGGFDSRPQEVNYQKTLFALIFLLQNTVLKFFDGEKCSEIEFKDKLEKLLGRLTALEMRKMGPPNYSRSIKSLVKFLGIQLEEDQLLDHHESIDRLCLKQMRSQEETLETDIYFQGPTPPTLHSSHPFTQANSQTKNAQSHEPATRKTNNLIHNKSSAKNQAQMGRNPENRTSKARQLKTMTEIQNANGRYSKVKPKQFTSPPQKQSRGLSPQGHPIKSGIVSIERSPGDGVEDVFPSGSRNVIAEDQEHLKLHQASIHTIKEFDHKDEEGDAFGATEPSQTNLNQTPSKNTTQMPTQQLPKSDQQIVGSQILFSSDPLISAEIENENDTNHPMQNNKNGSINEPKNLQDSAAVIMAVQDVQEALSSEYSQNSRVVRNNHDQRIRSRTGGHLVDLQQQEQPRHNSSHQVQQQEYNDETVKHNHTLQKILERAKKQFNNNSAGTLENQYVQEKKATEEREKNGAMAQNSKLNGGMVGGTGGLGPQTQTGSNKKPTQYTFAKNSPPAIQNAQKGGDQNNEKSAAKIQTNNYNININISKNYRLDGRRSSHHNVAAAHHKSGGSQSSSTHKYDHPAQIRQSASEQARNAKLLNRIKREGIRDQKQPQNRNRQGVKEESSEKREINWQENGGNRDRGSALITSGEDFVNVGSKAKLASAKSLEKNSKILLTHLPHQTHHRNGHKSQHSSKKSNERQNSQILIQSNLAAYKDIIYTRYKNFRTMDQSGSRNNSKNSSQKNSHKNIHEIQFAQQAHHSLDAKRGINNMQHPSHHENKRPKNPFNPSFSNNQQNLNYQRPVQRHNNQGQQMYQQNGRRQRQM